MEEQKAAEKLGRQTTKLQQQPLGFETITGPQEFTRGAVLNAVTKLIATNNQVGRYSLIPYSIYDALVAARTGR